MPFLLHSLFIRKSEVFSKEKVLALQPVFTESYQHMVQSNNIFCMRRLFTLCALALCSLAVMATTHNGKLTVSINGEVQSSSQASIDVADQGNGKFDLTLADFITTIGGNEMPVGTIRIAAAGTAQRAIRCSRPTRISPSRTVAIAVRCGWVPRWGRCR